MMVSKVMPLVASFQVGSIKMTATLLCMRWEQVADGLVGSCGGVLRGQGRLFQTLQMWLLTVI